MVHLLLHVTDTPFKLQGRLNFKVTKYPVYVRSTHIALSYCTVYSGILTRNMTKLFILSAFTTKEPAKGSQSVLNGDL